MKLTDPGYLTDFFEGYFCHNNVGYEQFRAIDLSDKAFPGGAPPPSHWSPGPNVVEMTKWAIPENVPLFQNALINSFNF